MLIEHTSGLTEDKPKIYKCVGVLRRSAECFNKKSLNMVIQLAMSHNPLSQRYQSMVNANNSSS